MASVRGQFVLRTMSIVATLASLGVVGICMGLHQPFRVKPALSGSEARRTGRWHAVYILGSDCSCSRRLVKHLCARDRRPGIDEQIISVDKDGAADPDLRVAGFPAERWQAARVRDVYGALSAPLLVIVDPFGEIRYSGGVSRRSDFRDGFHELEIWSAIQAGREVARYPVYGCALQFHD
jgi:hypothetical protein